MVSSVSSKSDAYVWGLNERHFVFLVANCPLPMAIVASLDPRLRKLLHCFENFSHILRGRGRGGGQNYDTERMTQSLSHDIACFLCIIAIMNFFT